MLWFGYESLRSELLIDSDLIDNTTSRNQIMKRGFNIRVTGQSHHINRG